MTLNQCKYNTWGSRSTCGPLKHAQIPSLARTTSLLVPRTVDLPHPLQTTTQVPSTGRPKARSFVPGASVLSCSLEIAQEPSLRSRATRPYTTPVGFVLPRLLAKIAYIVSAVVMVKITSYLWQSKAYVHYPMSSVTAHVTYVLRSTFYALG